MSDARERWFKELVGAGLEHEIFTSADLIEKATPEVLAEHLPADVMAKVLASALSAGAMTADRMLETLTPEICAKHIPHDVLWACATGGAKRSGIADANGEVQATDKRRTFISRVLACALDNSIATPEDVVKHVTAELLAQYLPTEVKASLLARALEANAMNPSLIVDVVGPDVFARNVPLKVVWACIDEVGTRSIGDDAASGNKGKAAATAAPKKATKAAASGRAGAATKPPTKKPAPRPIAGGSAPRPIGASGNYDEDTNVHDWAGADDFEVVEEADALGAVPDPMLPIGSGAARSGTDWSHDETTDHGIDSTNRGK